jgi:hypothetical protein
MLICQDEQFEDLGCAEECTAWAAVAKSGRKIQISMSVHHGDGAR